MIVEDSVDFLIIFLWNTSVFISFSPILIESLLLKKKIDWFSPVFFTILLSIPKVFYLIILSENGWQGRWFFGKDTFVLIMQKYILLEIFSTIIYLLGYYSNFSSYLLD